MTDFPKEALDNPTLGAAADNRRLDVVEEQERENERARKEGRDPMTVVSDITHPGFRPLDKPGSNHRYLHFKEIADGEVKGENSSKEDSGGEPKVEDSRNLPKASASKSSQTVKTGVTKDDSSGSTKS